MTRPRPHTIAAAIAAAAALAFAPGLTPADALAQGNAAKAQGDEYVRIVLSSGREVTGKLLEENDADIRVLVMMGSISAPTTYDRSEIIRLERNVPAPGQEAASKADQPGRPTLDKPDAVKPEDPDTSIVYVIELNDTFGIDVSETPLAETFEEIDEYFDDIGPDGRVRSDKRDKNVVVLRMDTGTNPRQGFDGIWRAEQISPVVEQQIIQKGRRIVFWIEQAQGGAAFLPWISDEIYFTTDGEMGGVGTLGEFDIGDEMVNEKQISLRLGHAEGFAIKGGYDQVGPPIIRAMARSQNWLAVKWVGGEPVFLEAEPPADQPEWIVLTDDGEGENEDEFSYKGNDVLRINADLAIKLGISDGTADDIDDLAYLLDIGRDPFIVYNEDEYEDADAEAKAQDVLATWSDQIQDAAEKINQRNGTLWREFNEIQVDGEYRERVRDRGRKIRILKQIRALVTRFSEVFDASGQSVAQLDVQIEQLRLEAEADRRENRRAGR